MDQYEGSYVVRLLLLCLSPSHLTFLSSLSLSSVWIFHFSRLHPFNSPFHSLLYLSFSSPPSSLFLFLSFSISLSLSLRELGVHEDEGEWRCLSIDWIRWSSRLLPEFPTPIEREACRSGGSYSKIARIVFACSETALWCIQRTEVACIFTWARCREIKRDKRVTKRKALAYATRLV